MPKDNENVPLPLSPPEGTLSSSASQPYATDQMVRCEECLRANPPTRVNCLYCAAALPLNETTVNLQKPALRPLEKWERGYNIILLPSSANPQSATLSDSALAEAADILRLTSAALVRILNCGRPMPLARAATVDEGALVQRRLTRLEINTTVIPDAELGIDESAPLRVRAVEIDDEGISAYQTPESQAIRLLWFDFVVFVVGRLVVKRVELREKTSGADDNRILNSSEFFSDESVVDLYTRKQTTPYRIAANGFDFSCLGKGKSLVAAENISGLLKLFREYAPQAQLDDSYNSSRKALDAVWPSEQQNESGGWSRERPGKYTIGSVTEISNEMQFLKYSRLRYYFQPDAKAGTNEDS